MDTDKTQGIALWNELSERHFFVTLWAMAKPTLPLNLCSSAFICGFPATLFRLRSPDSQAIAMGAFPVSLEKEAQLTQRMTALGVREADIEESFVRSGGHGGQNVNKTSTCVMLLHRPTGLQVKCQATRSNRELRLSNGCTSRRLKATRVPLLPVNS